MNDYSTGGREMTFAMHIRARLVGPYERTAERVETDGLTFHYWREVVRDHYWIHLTNTRTGKVLVKTDAYGLAGAMDAAARLVETARGTLFWSLRPKDLR